MRNLLTSMRERWNAFTEDYPRASVGIAMTPVALLVGAAIDTALFLEVSLELQLSL